MSGAYAVIKSLVGQVFTVSAEGIRRQVFEGERIFAGETIETGPLSSATLELANGETLALGNAASWQAGDAELTTDRPADSQPLSDLEKAIADGFDPTTQLAPTAAGPGASGTGGAGGGSHSVVMLIETGARVEAVTGFATEGLSAAATAAEQDSGSIDNLAPLALDGSTGTEENTVLEGRVPTARDADTITGYTLVAGPGAGNGTLTFNADGRYRFEPGSDFDSLAQGQTRQVTFTYTATDSYGVTSQPASVTLTVTGTNDAPVATGSYGASLADSAARDTFAPRSGQLVASDVDSRDLVWSGSAQGRFGQLIVNADGSYRYTPDPAAVNALREGETATDSFIVTVSDSLGGSDTRVIDIAVSGANDVPIAEATQLIGGSVTEDDGQVTGQLVASDADASDRLTYTLLGNAPAGFVLNADGSWSLDTSLADYQSLAAGEDLTLSLDYVVTDASGASSISVLDVLVAGRNDAPLAQPGSASATEDEGRIGGQLGASDVDASDRLTFALAGTAPEGFVLEADGRWTLDTSIETYQGLAEGEPLVLTVPYMVTDAAGATSSSALRITLTGTNDAAIIDTAAVQLAESDASLSAEGRLSVRDIDGPDAFVAQPGTQGQYGTFSLDAAGNWRFVANSAFDHLNEGDRLSESFEVASADGTRSTVSIVLNGTNDAPQVQGEAQFKVADTSADDRYADIAGQLSATDADDSQLIWSGSAGGKFGTLTVNADGSYLYVVNAAAVNALNAGETPVDLFEVTVTDPHGGTATQTIRIDVTGSNDAPLATATDAAANEDQVIAGQLAATDLDANEQLTFSPDAPLPAGFVLNANGSWTFDAGAAAYQHLADGQSLTLDIPFTTRDAAGSSSSSSLRLVVTGTNDGPVAQPATASALEDAATTAGPVASATEGATLTLTVTTTTPGEAVSFDWAFSTGDYLPYNDFAFVQVNGEPVERLSSVASVGDYGSSGTHAFSHAFAVPGTYTLVIGVADARDTANDSRLTLSNLSSNASQTGAAGSVDQTASGWQLTSSGATGQTLVDQLDFGIISGQLQASDIDDGATLSFDLSGTAPAGFVLNGDGRWTFDVADPAYDNLADGEVLTLVIPYRATDDQGASGQSALTLTITGTNDAPVATASAAAVDEDGTVNGTLAATDIDHGASLAYSLNTAAPAGFVLNANGSWTFDATHAAYQQMTQGETLTLSIPYTVTDELGASSASTLTLVVGGVNDAPVVSAAVIGETDEDAGPLVVDLLANASDIDRGATLSVINLTETSGNDTRGVTFDAASGRLTIDPQQYSGLSVGQTLTFTYTYDVIDGNGGVTPTGATIAVEGRNDAPVVTDSSVNAAEESTGTALNIAAPTDIDANDVLTISVTGLPDLGRVTLADGTAVQNGQSLTLAELQGLKYDGPADYATGQTVGHFSYRVSDGTTSVVGTVALNVTPVNDAPTASDDLGAITGLKGAYYAYRDGTDGPNLSNLAGVTAFIASHQPSATFVATTLNYGNGVTTNLGAEGQLQRFLGTDAASLNADPANSSDAIIQLTGNLQLTAGTYQFRVTADDGFRIRIDGVVVAQYNANQGATRREFATFEVGESGAHDIEILYWDQGGSARLLVEMRPQGGSYSALGGAQLSHVGDSALTTDEDTALTIDSATLLGNDLDIDGDTLTLTGVGNAVNGTVALLGNGQVVFTPAGNFNGTGSFTYTVSDGNGGTATATATVGVRPANDAPAAIDQTVSTAEDTALSGKIVATDLDGDALAYALLGNAGHGSVQLNAATGAYTYTPDGDYNGADTFTVRVSDGNGGYADSVVNVVVTPVNDAPAAQPITLPAIEEDGSLTFTATQLLAGAQDGDGDTLSVANLQLASGDGTLTANDDGTWTFTPTADWNGEVRFSYDVSDGDTTAPNTAALTVTPANDGPSVSDAQLTTAEDQSISSTVSAQDAEGDTLSYTIQSGGAHGSLLLNTATGAYTYTPNANYNGTDSFTLRTYDSKGGYADSVVSVAITPVNDAPAVSPIILPAIEEDGSLTFTAAQLLASTQDVDGDNLSVVDLQLTSGNGALSANADGSWTFTPAANWNGSASFSFGVDDGTVTVASSASLAVTAVNDAPTTVDVQLKTDENTSISGQVVATDTEGDALSYNLQSSVAHGSLVLNTVTGAYTYTPNANYNGADTFTVRVSDGNGGHADSVVSIEVAAVNEAPQVQPITLPSISEDGSLTFSATDLLAGAQDGDGDTLSVVDLQLASGSGALTDNGDGTWTFTPAADWNGEVGFSYGVSDGTVTVGNTAALKVDAVNDNPQVEPITLPSIAEEGSLTITEAQLLAGATDADGDTLSVVDLRLASGNGTLTANNDGSWTFTPTADWNGAVSFGYGVSDGAVTVPNTASLTVNANNDAPKGADKAIGLNEDGSYTFGAADFGFSDVDSADALQAVRIDTLPTAGTLTLNGAAVAAGQVVVAGDLAGLTFQPAHDGSGNAYAGLAFSVADLAGRFSATPNTVTFDVAAEADTPTVSVDVGTPSLVSTSITSANAASSGQGFSVTAYALDGTAGTLSSNGSPSGFGVAGAASGADTELGFANARSERLSVSFDAPVVSATVSFAWLSSSEQASYALYDAAGTVIGSGTVRGVTDAIDSPVTLTSNGGSAISRIEFSAQSAADDYLVHSITFVSATRYPLTLTAGTTDIDHSESIDSVRVAVPAKAVLSAGSDNGDGTWTLPLTSQGAYSVVIDPVTQAVTITGLSLTVPGAPSDSLGLTVTATARDGSATASASAELTLGDTLAPDTLNATRVADEDATAIDLTLSATDAASGIAGFTLVSLPAHGTLSYQGQPVSAGQLIPAAANQATLQFKPDANWNGTTALQYSASDAAGNQDSSPATLSIQVVAVNDAPVNQLPTGFWTAEDRAIRLDDLSISDVDAGNRAMSVTLGVNGGTLGAASANGVTATLEAGQLVLSGTLDAINAYLADASTQPVYTPVDDASGVVILTLVTSDLGNVGSGGALSDSDTRLILIEPVADAIEADNLSVVVGTPTTSAIDFASDAIAGLDGVSVYSFPSGITLSALDTSGAGKVFTFSNGSLLAVRSSKGNGDNRIEGSEAIRVDFPVDMQSVNLRLKNAGDDSVRLTSELEVGQLPANRTISGALTSTGTTPTPSSLKVQLILTDASGNRLEPVEATVNADGTWSLNYTHVGAISAAELVLAIDGGLFNQGGNSEAHVGLSTSVAMESLTIAQDAANPFGQKNNGFQIEYLKFGTDATGAVSYQYPVDVFAAVQDTVGVAETITGLTLSDLPADAVLGLRLQDGSYVEIGPDAEGRYDLSAYVALLSTPTTTSGTDQLQMFTGTALASDYSPTLTLVTDDLTSTATSILGGSASSTLSGAAGDDYVSGGAGDDRLQGLAGDDTLDGGSGADSLLGGLGDDILIGGSGADTFAWQAGDTGQDVIEDFDAGEGDRIDLSDLLVGENEGNILDFLRVDTATSTLQISTTGQFGQGGEADATLALRNGGSPVDLSGYGGDASAIIHSLIAGADPLVKVDH